MWTLFFALACRPTPTTLDALLAEPDPERAGRRLMRTPMGLNRLDAGPASGAAVVAVHGFGSEGTEWVEPLRLLDSPSSDLYFYHWEDHGCPLPAAEALHEALSGLAAGPLLIVAHSYGGLIAALAAQTGPVGAETRVEIVASPLAGHETLQERCDFAALPQLPPADGVAWRQWRTQHEADGAFQDLPADPQDWPVPGLEVVELPAEWEGGRLGHNRSLQYVARALSQPAL